MADLSHPLAYAEEHPYVAGAIVFGGGLALLWLFGFFSSSSGSGTDSATTSMAAAYYAAEAQQAVAGTQLNIATEQAQAATAQTALQTGAAVAIEQAHGTTEQNIAASMYGSQTTLGLAGTAAGVTTAGYAADVAKTGIVYGAQTAAVQANDAMNTSIAGNSYAYLTAKAGTDAAALQDAMHTIIPQELAMYGQSGFTTQIGGQQFASGLWGNPNIARASGFDPAQVAAMFPPG
jgi:hydroxylamine reductase (hybrid-cluster protein)